MVLHTRGRVGSRRFSAEAPSIEDVSGLSLFIAACSPAGPWASGAFRGKTGCLSVPQRGERVPTRDGGNVGSRRFFSSEVL